MVCVQHVCNLHSQRGYVCVCVCVWVGVCVWVCGWVCMCACVCACACLRTEAPAVAFGRAYLTSSPPPYHLLPPPPPGKWWVARSYIDVESITQQACALKNRTDGYTRYWDVIAYRDLPTCLVAPNPPECLPAPWSRVNHLGNGRSGVPLNYTWAIPYFPSGNTKLAVVRLR